MTGPNKVLYNIVASDPLDTDKAFSSEGERHSEAFPLGKYMLSYLDTMECRLANERRKQQHRLNNMKEGSVTTPACTDYHAEDGRKHMSHGDIDTLLQAKEALVLRLSASVPSVLTNYTEWGYGLK